MASTVTILSMLLFLALSSQCYSQCTINDISIRQYETGARVQGKPEWRVVLINICNCVIYDVNLNCAGFQTVEEIDPLILSVFGDTCLVNGGQSIYRDPITFTYAWDTSFPLNPVYTSYACSSNTQGLL